MKTRSPFHFVDTVFHIGADRSELLGELLAVAVQNVYATVADPDRFDDLNAKYAKDEVTLLKAVVIGDGDPASDTFRRYNLSSLSGLRHPLGASKLYPGLKLEEEIAAPILSVHDAIDKLEFDFGKINCLLIYGAGEEFDILHALHTTHKLTKFDYVFVQAGEISLYENAHTASQITDWMAEAGYLSAGKVIIDDPQIPLLQFGLDYQKLRAVLDERRKSLDVATARVEELQSTLSDAKSELAEKEEKLNKGNAEFAEKEKEFIEGKAEFAEKESALRNDLRISLYTQSSTQNDLKELQERYKSLSIEKAAQDDLLRRVTQRLKTASDYLGVLEGDDVTMREALSETASETMSDQEDNES